MLLYHGSPRIIKKSDIDPRFNLGGELDHGHGFYMGTDEEYSLMWAAHRTDALYKNWYEADEAPCYANMYEYDIDGARRDLRVLDYLDGSHTSLEWMGSMLKNRDRQNWKNDEIEAWLKSFSPETDDNECLYESSFEDCEKYDVIISYRADDSLFKTTSEFINGTISHYGAKRKLTRGLLGIEVVLKTSRALQYLTYINSRKEVTMTWRKNYEEKQRIINREISQNSFEQDDYYIDELYGIFESDFLYIPPKELDFYEIESYNEWSEEYQRLLQAIQIEYDWNY